MRQRARRITKPKISPDYNIEDIRKIGEWHKKRRGMTPEEICKDISMGANRFAARFRDTIDSAIMAEIERRMAAVSDENAEHHAAATRMSCNCLAEYDALAGLN